MDTLLLILGFPAVVLLGFLALAACGLLGSDIMKRKGRNADVGATLGLLLGVVGVLVALAVPARRGAPSDNAISPTRPVPPMPTADNTDSADRSQNSQIAA